METALSEDQLLIRNAMRDLLDRELTFDRIRELEADGGYAQALWGQLASLGWLGLPFSDAAGGGGGSLVDLAIVAEEVARHAAVIPFAPVMAAGLALAAGSPELHPELRRIGEGQAIIVPAVLDAQDTYGTARLEVGPDGALSGERLFVEYGQHATGFLVAGDGALWLVANEAPTAVTRPLRTIARTPVAAVDLRGAKPAGPGRLDALSRLIEVGRLLAAVECLAVAQQALDMTVDYVKNRVQFGRPIGTFQAVQHHCANMATMADAMRFLVYEAAWALDAGVQTPDQVALAKAWASEAAIEITALAHQLHGGIGVTEEYNLHFFSRRAKERAAAWGTTDECLALAASTIETNPDWA